MLFIASGYNAARPVLQTEVHDRAMRLVSGRARLALQASPSTDVVDQKTDV